jgi:hypothetical protein
MLNSSNNLDTNTLIKKFWFKVIPTWLLVIGEGVALLLFPLVIGRSVDGLINNSYSGLYELGLLAIGLLILGSARRFYDTRVYTKIYRQEVGNYIEKSNKANIDVSKITARVNLFTEIVTFLEESIPEIIGEVIGLVGTIILIYFISVEVFWLCLGAMLIIIVVYLFSKNRIYRLNSKTNNEYEKQVSVLETRNKGRIDYHLGLLQKYRVNLSDLETINYGLVWLVLGSVLIASIILITTNADITRGNIVSGMMYVFGFVEGALIFPFFFQEMIRLNEIGNRLS